MRPLPSLSRALALSVAMLIALTARAELPREVSAQLARLGIDDKGLSVVVRRVDADGPLLAHNADVPRNPASTMKLVTTYAGLDLLGPAYRWHTRVYADGSVRDGRLDGDLVLKGGGDPYLVIEDYWRLLHAIRDRGIERIDGDLVIDDTVFDRAAIGTDAIDGRDMRSYNTPPEALLVNFRATRFVVVPGSRSVRVFADPPATTLAIDNRLEPASGACQGGQRNIGFHVVPGSGRTTVRFSGRYPSRCGEWSLTRTVLPADQYQLGVFKAVWAEMGGSLAGGLRYGRAPAAEPLVDHASRPLAEALAGINKYSNNVMARQLLLTLAAETGAGPASPQAGAAAIRDWLDSRGIVMPGLVIENGAGLSRRARLTATGLADLLIDAWRHPFMPEFLASLPLAAIDGSMQRRFTGSAGAGRMRLKTGLLDDVRAAAGYVMAQSGRMYVVVMLHNHPGIDSGAGTAVQDELLGWLFRNH